MQNTLEHQAASALLPEHYARGTILFPKSSQELHSSPCRRGTWFSHKPEEQLLTLEVGIPLLPNLRLQEKSYHSKTRSASTPGTDE